MGDIETHGADQPAGEGDRTREWARAGGNGKSLAQPIHEAGDGPVGFDPSASDIDGVAITSDLETLAEPDEGVAAYTIAVLDTFQQEAWVERPELEIHRGRSVQVGWYVEEMIQVGLLSPDRRMSS
jgi:hypothetical protein